MTHRIGRNQPCPCGSGKKYKNCCWGKAFDYVEDDEGTVHRRIPMSEEARELLLEQRQAFIEAHGRPPGPGDDVFFDAPHPEHLEHTMVQSMREVGISPDKVYAFTKTGLLVSEENRKLIPDADIKAWCEAVEEYHERFGAVLALPLPWKKSEFAGKTIAQISADGRAVAYIAEYTNYLLNDGEELRYYTSVANDALARLRSQQAAEGAEATSVKVSIEDPVESVVPLFVAAANVHEEGVDAVTAFESCLFVDDFAMKMAERWAIADNAKVRAAHEAAGKAGIMMLFVAVNQHFGLQETPEREREAKRPR
jgi:SEC-C motif-containing protein